MRLSCCDTCAVYVNEVTAERAVHKRRPNYKERRSYAPLARLWLGTTGPTPATRTQTTRALAHRPYIAQPSSHTVRNIAGAHPPPYICRDGSPRQGSVVVKRITYSNILSLLTLPLPTAAHAQQRLKEIPRPTGTSIHSPSALKPSLSYTRPQGYYPQDRERHRLRAVLEIVASAPRTA